MFKRTKVNSAALIALGGALLTAGLFLLQPKPAECGLRVGLHLPSQLAALQPAGATIGMIARILRLISSVS